MAKLGTQKQISDQNNSSIGHDKFCKFLECECEKFWKSWMILDWSQVDPFAGILEWVY
jgi:hypothetical protein